LLPERIRQAIFWTSDAAFGPWTLALLMGTGLFLSIRYRFVQVRRFREAFRTMVPKAPPGGEGPLSPFQSFMTALGATIGTGNIAGVAAAVVSGGPGAVFWIWAYGFFATAIKFTEAILGIKYRRLDASGLSAGPMHYLRDGMHMPRLGWLYALIAGIAALTTTPFTQPNSMALVLNTQFGLPTLASGIVIAVLTWLVIIGGVRSIGRAAEKLSPAKVGLYLLGGLLVIATHLSALPGTLATIFREAFSLRAAAGGTAGILVAIRYGLARGIYANEAGYGTAAVVYGTARSDRPVQQGLNAVMEVFIVSFLTSSISALTVLLTGAWQSGQTSTAAVALAFNTTMPVVGGWIVAFCAFLFGYTTLIGWAYYGEQFLEYVFGRGIVLPYRWVYCGLIVFGAVAKVELVWAWGDLMNGLQVFPNLVGVLGLSGVVAAMLRADPGDRRAADARPGR
jgi:alanine or glycine:cation symporter, AGCS family